MNQAIKEWSEVKHIFDGIEGEQECAFYLGIIFAYTIDNDDSVNHLKLVTELAEIVKSKLDFKYGISSKQGVENGH